MTNFSQKIYRFSPTQNHFSEKQKSEITSMIVTLFFHLFLHPCVGSIKTWPKTPPSIWHPDVYLALESNISYGVGRPLKGTVNGNHLDRFRRTRVQFRCCIPCTAWSTWCHRIFLAIACGTGLFARYSTTFPVCWWQLGERQHQLYYRYFRKPLCHLQRGTHWTVLGTAYRLWWWWTELGSRH